MNVDTEVAWLRTALAAAMRERDDANTRAHRVAQDFAHLKLVADWLAAAAEAYVEAEKQVGSDFASTLEKAVSEYRLFTGGLP